MKTKELQRFVKQFNCPLCGADVFIRTNSNNKVYCCDNDCPAHRYGLVVGVDSEGIGYLGEAV